MYKSSKRLIAMLICLAMVLSMLPMSVFADGTPSTLYLTPNANWNIDGARFAAYFFGNGETWVSMTDSNGDGVYEVEVPAGYPNVIFCRMDPANATNSWDTKWNQTADLTVPTDGTNWYTVKENTWNAGGGSWSTFSTECSHEYDDGKVTTEATCTTDGEKTYTCNLCGATKTESIAATGHTFVDGACSCGATCNAIYFDNTDAWETVYVHYWGGSSSTSWPGNTLTLVEGTIYTCNVPTDATSIIFHNNGGTQTDDLTIPTDGKNQYTYSTAVWSVYGEAACTHTNVTALAGKDATCTESGLTKGEVCGDCGYVITAQEVIPALGHSYDDDNVCETCGFAREMITVYFENNWAWVGVKCFTWGGSSVDSWPGVSAYLSDYVSEGGAAIYYAQIWNDVDGLIWNGTKTENGEIVYNEDGSEVTDQTPDIKEFADGTVWYMAWDEAGACNTVGTYDVSVFEPTCEHEYFYACDAHCMHCGELTNEDAAHSIIKVEAVEAVCGSNGNVEYYTCEYCGGCWLDEALTLVTNRFSVITFKDHNIIHVEAVDATCFEQGNVEYWYCSDCETVWADEALTQITNHKNVIVGVSHSIEHVEAKAATCFEEGNIEYWYCTECGFAWTDELLREVTNLKSVITPAAHNYVGGSCTECGDVEFDVKFQAKDDGTAIRLLSYVGDLSDYAKVTFKVTINGVTKDLVCTNAYKSLNANGNQIAASQVFGEGAEYFVMYTLTGITEALAGTEISVSVVWTAIDGTEIEGEARTYVIGG